MISTTVLSLTTAKNNDVVIRLAMNAALQALMPGQYIHLAANSYSQMESSAAGFAFVVNKAAGYVEIYLRQSEAEKLGTDVSITEVMISEPKGEGFLLSDITYLSNTPKKDSKPVLLADEAGLPAILFLAEKIKSCGHHQPLVFLFSNKTFPFTPIPSQFVISNIPMGVLAACPMLEDKKIPSRLICDTFTPGCYDGNAKEFLAELSASAAFFSPLTIELYAAGQNEILCAVDAFSEKHHLALQKITDCVQPV